MESFHRYLGEGLFVIYLFVIIVVLFVGRRNRPVPTALLAVAHGLLALQVVLGIILISEDADRITIIHPILGLLAILTLGLTPVLRGRLGQRSGMLATLGVVAVLILAAMTTAMAA